MKTVAVCNHKGGVGKTAVSMALAEGLNAKGHRTLLIDLDQQLNATTAAGAETEGVVTAYDLLTSFDYKAVEGVQHYERGDIVAGDVLVAEAEGDMLQLDTPLTMLADSMAGLEDSYDFVVIDCPPSLGLVTRNAMVAADGLLVVVTPDASSVDGFGKVVEAAAKIRRNKRLNPALGIFGVLVNQYDGRGQLDRQLDAQLPELAGEAGTRVFESRIRRCVAVRQAQSRHVSLYDFDPKCAAAKDMEAVVDEFIGIAAGN